MYAQSPVRLLSRQRRCARGDAEGLVVVVLSSVGSPTDRQWRHIFSRWRQSISQSVDRGITISMSWSALRRILNPRCCSSNRWLWACRTHTLTPLRLQSPTAQRIGEPRRIDSRHMRLIHRRHRPLRFLPPSHHSRQSPPRRRRLNGRPQTRSLHLAARTAGRQTRFAHRSRRRGNSALPLLCAAEVLAANLGARGCRIRGRGAGGDGTAIGEGGGEWVGV